MKGFILERWHIPVNTAKQNSIIKQIAKDMKKVHIANLVKPEDFPNVESEETKTPQDPEQYEKSEEHFQSETFSTPSKTEKVERTRESSSASASSGSGSSSGSRSGSGSSSSSSGNSSAASSSNANNICEEGFKVPSKFKSRQLINTIEKLPAKSHSCQICGKAVGSAKQLKRHQKIHTGEKSNSCMICNKKFRTLENLKALEIRHGERGERPFSCDICLQRFCEKSKLKRHQLIHEGEKPHPCNYCDLKFRQHNHLKRHVQTIHAGGKTED